eukprot:CAMPEP_0198724466 /NCGR_PEP_ID=MMETSP1475-20131203/1935_1 /TAXON_ID= ORGANISM="Unidentified sp., Strain CCMP1999" /NCGR_SAMPLE_ID=MMETSP1475 /ASSEMBLY_ACC=CAM_ASM_001111 /LENGTH=46 /DNA_ID= /DNA_START= /DNA_END= /DNA_ORIENTATION=
MVSAPLIITQKTAPIPGRAGTVPAHEGGSRHEVEGAWKEEKAGNRA